MSSDDQKFYSVSMDRLAKIITGVLVTAAIGLPSAGFLAMWFSEGTMNINAGFPWFLPGGIIVLIVMICRFLRITGYVVQKHSLKILRPVMPLEIEYSAIREVLTPSRAEMRGSYRLFGNGGVSGYFGIFRNSEFGVMRWYATRISGFIMLVDSENQKLVLTPDNSEMAEDIRKRCLETQTLNPPTQLPEKRA